MVEVLTRLFGFIERPVRAVDIRTAEALKYACNAFHATKVSFTNELGRVFRPLGIDTREVMKLFCEDDQLNISTRYLRPGFAFGGSCLPKDLRSLLHLARMDSVDLPLLAGTLATNRLSVSDVVERVIAGEGRIVTLFGLSFKIGQRRSPREPLRRAGRDPAWKGLRGPHLRPDREPVRPHRCQPRLRGLEAPASAKRPGGEARPRLCGAPTSRSCRSPTREVVEALLATPPVRIIDLDGRLGSLDRGDGRLRRGRVVEPPKGLGASGIKHPSGYSSSGMARLE